MVVCELCNEEIELSKGERIGAQALEHAILHVVDRDTMWKMAKELSRIVDWIVEQLKEVDPKDEELEKLIELALQMDELLLFLQTWVGRPNYTRAINRILLEEKTCPRVRKIAGV